MRIIDWSSDVCSSDLRIRIGVVGICGSVGFAISAAKMDPRLKANATVSMYDMGAVTRNGLNRSVSVDQRKALLAQAAEQRYTEFTTEIGRETCRESVCQYG